MLLNYLEQWNFIIQSSKINYYKKITKKNHNPSLYKYLKYVLFNQIQSILFLLFPLLYHFFLFIYFSKILDGLLLGTE